MIGPVIDPVDAWLLIAVLAVGTVVVRAIGPLLAGGREPPEVVTRVIALSAPALIAALVVSNTVADGDELVLDARLIGVGVGGLALWLKAPLVLALVRGALAAAGARALGAP